MHHALEIQEILYNIFSRYYYNSDLLALATTCRAFKEPALDLLWEKLHDLSPLVRCLPGAFHLVNYNEDEEDEDDGDIDDMYSFSRPLTPNEWEILQSYTRRIRIVYNLGQGLDEQSLRILLTPPTSQPLFPNLHCLFYLRDKPDESLKLFSSSLNVTNVSVYVDQSSITFNKLVSNCICGWRNLRFSVRCPNISLEFDALAHLARVPTLSYLSFKEVVADCTLPLLFSKLRKLSINPASLPTASRLLSHILLPSIKYLIVKIDGCPSKQDLSSFLADIKGCNTGHTIKSLLLAQRRFNTGPRPCSLSLADLRSCMEFSNLSLLRVDIAWTVGLTDDALLTLASSWPNLESLFINNTWGWKAQGGGLTPNGFVQLLQTCPSLREVSLAMDTRGYTEPSPANPGFTTLHDISLNVLDSVIEAESVPAVIAFLSGIYSHRRLLLYYWLDDAFQSFPGWRVYRDRWNAVQSQFGRRR